MRKKSRRSRGRAGVEIPSALKAVALIVLALAVVALCYLAIQHGRGNASAATSARPTTSGSAAPADPSAQATTDSPPAQVEPAASNLSSATQILVATGEDSAYRAIAGSCPDGGSSIGVTDDGGATWTSFDVGASLGIGAIQSVTPGGTGYASLIGQNLQDCASASAGQTYSSGNDWEAASRVLSTTWYMEPTNPQALVAPGGIAVEAPCALGRLTGGTEDSVAGICTDGRVVLSSDAGSSWLQSESIAGVDAIALTDSGLVVTAVGQPQCADGVAIQNLDSSLALTAETCAPAGASAAGQTSVSAAPDGTLWLLSGENVLRSSDSGTSWE